MSEDTDWAVQGAAVRDACQRHLPGLVGVCVHGSAALGGVTAASDLDVLVVTDTAAGLAELGRSLLETASFPRPLELSVVASAAAIQPQAPWPYLLHVNSADDRVTADDGAGDPDLIAHYAVARQSGLSLLGPEPANVIGPVDREELLEFFAGELQWGLEHADQRYAVLNACRAVAYAATGELLSKVDGATWWLRTRGQDLLAERAREAQADGVDLGAASPAAREFVDACVAELHDGRAPTLQAFLRGVTGRG